MEKEDLVTLRRRYEELKRRAAELEREKRELEKRLSEASAMAADYEPPATSPAELERILSRLIKKIGMIVQAEKCVFMLYDPDAKELVAQKPALGLTDEQVEQFREPPTDGFSGTVFSTGKPLIIKDLTHDQAVSKAIAYRLGVHNSLSVPLVIEKRDEDHRLLEKQLIGVLHVFNKRFGNEFTEEDVRLLQILAKQLASIISSARIYFKLVEEKKQLEATIESMVAGVILVDEQGKVSLMNATAKRILGVSPEERVVGKFYREIVQNETVQDLIHRTLTQDEESMGEISVRIGEGEEARERIYQVQSAPVRDEEGRKRGVVAIMTDITHIRVVERMKSAFVSTVSHELRTPLTSIKGFVSTLLSDEEGYFDLETRREFLQIIDQETDRLKRLIDDLLNLSRIESGRALEIRWKQIDLHEVVNRIVEAQKTYTDKHTFVVDLPEDLPPVMADEDKVEQILTNLLSNAVKYSPNGGEIRVAARDTGQFVEISVSDQGIGIPPDKIDKIFERFYRMDDRDTREAGGTGIGLYLTRHLVMAHGGKIWVESEVGKGSTFYFTLPKEIPEEAKEEEKGKEVAEKMATEG